jgi:hypothetical protein
MQEVGTQVHVVWVGELGHEHVMPPAVLHIPLLHAPVTGVVSFIQGRLSAEAPDALSLFRQTRSGQEDGEQVISAP